MKHREGDGATRRHVDVRIVGAERSGISAARYVRRALPSLPAQGSKAPWKLHQNYVKDLFALRVGRVDEPELEFSRNGGET